jgi:hypothetical protein
VESLAGRRFGRLTVLHRTVRSRWLCRCKCGKQIEVRSAYLKPGRQQSCGCARSDPTYVLPAAAARRTHGRSETVEYRAWRSMKARCDLPSQVGYPRYGGRGIQVCARWRHSFENFFADMGPRPSAEHSMDRIDNDGHYKPGNCRWALKYRQVRNRSNNHVVTLDGRTMILSDWIKELGLSRAMVASRLGRGWTPGQALTEPRRHHIPSKIEL